MDMLMPDEDMNSQDQIENIPSISGAKNQSNHGKAFPFVMGKHLFTPMIIGKGYTEVTGTDGEEQYYIVEFLAGYNDILLKDFKLGTRDLAKNTAGVTNGYVTIDGYYSVDTYDPKIEIRSSGECELYPQKVVEEQLNIDLMHIHGEQPLEVVRFSARYPQKVQVEVSMAGLIGYSESGKKENRTVSVQLEYSVDGSATWIPFGSFTGVTSYAPETGISTWTRQKSKVMRFVAEKTLTPQEALNCTNKVIEIRVVRTNESATDNRSTDGVTLTAIRTWCYDYKASVESVEQGGGLVIQRPMIAKDRDRTCRVAFKIKANNALTGTINEFNFIAQSKGRTFVNVSWSSISSTSVTQNPASIALLALQSVMRGSNAYTDAQIDLDSFGEFFTFCEQKGYKCNGILVSEKKTIEIVNNILQCGKGVLTIINNKYGVLIDKPRTTPIMILNAQNVLEATNTKEFAKLPDGYKVKFINELNDYTQDEMIVCYDGHSATDPDLVLEEIEIAFVTNPTQVWKIVRYQLACRKLRPEVWNRKVSVEGGLIEIGSLVTIQDDTLVVGIGEGAEIIDLVYDDDTNPSYVMGIKTDGHFDVTDATEEYCVKIMVANGTSEPKIITKKVIVSAVGSYSNFAFDEPILFSDTYKPNIGDILSFGIYNLESIDAICFGKKQNSDGTYDLTFIPYAEGVYTADEGEMPEFDSKVSRPIDYDKAVMLPQGASTDFVSSVMNGVVEGTAEDIGAPNDPVQLVAQAERDRILLSCTLIGTGLRNALQGFEWQVRKGNTPNDVWQSVTGSEYIFDRATDGYPEAEDFVNWRFRVRAKNTYNNYSDYVECNVNTTKYGTWLVTNPFINTRVSDRTITLLLGQEDRAVYKQQYGEIRYRIQVARYDDYTYDENHNIIVDENNNPVLQFYQPNVNGNPRPVRNSEGTVIVSNEDNYKTSSTSLFAVSGSAYSQTMPLKHQDGVEWEDEAHHMQKGSIDTQYYFKVIAYNASVYNTEIVSQPVIATAIALCTNIQDIVFANDGIKEQYVQKLSAISANIGVITQGSFSGSNYNYWALSDIDAGSSPTGQSLKSGAFRVGGKDKFLQVIPKIDPVSGLVYDYEFILHVGAFEISTERTQLDSELVIYNPEISKFYRTRLTVSGTFYDYRPTETSDWVVIAKQDTGGIMSKSVYSDASLILSNMSIAERRARGFDIGKPYLSDNSRVFHFDTDGKDQHGNADYDIIVSRAHVEGYPCIIGADGRQYDLDGEPLENPYPYDETQVDFKPVILAIAPYSEVARSLFGKYGLHFDLTPQGNKFTVDFWIKYYYAENQVLFDIGTAQDKIQIICTSGEPNYNVPQTHTIAYPQPTAENFDEDEYYILVIDQQDPTHAEYVRQQSYVAGLTYYVAVEEPPYNYDVNLTAGYRLANPQPTSQADFEKAELYYVLNGNDVYERALVYESGVDYYVHIIPYNHAKVNQNDVYIKHQGVSTFEICRLADLVGYSVADPQPTQQEDFIPQRPLFKYENNEYVRAYTYDPNTTYYVQGEEFSQGVWKHIAVVMTPTTISCYIGTHYKEFARYSNDDTDTEVTINDADHSLILDELMIDEKTAEDFTNNTGDSFLASTNHKIPWGTIHSEDDCLLLVAKEDSNGKPKLVTNIFNSNELATKIEGIAQDITDDAVETLEEEIGTVNQKVTKISKYVLGEVNTGKLWIDNKPIYRLVTLPTRATGNGNVIPLDNFYTDYNANIPLSCVIVGSTETKNCGLIRKSGNHLYVYVDSNILATDYLVIEYTKAD